MKKIRNVGIKVVCAAVVLLSAFAMLAACASGGVQSNAAVAAATAPDDTDIVIRDASDSQTFAGALSVNSESAWNAAINKIRNGGDNKDYVIHVTDAVTVPAIPVDEYLFGNVTGISVTIQGGGTLAKDNSPGSLIRIGAGQIVTLKDITLQGYIKEFNNYAVVRILRDGTLYMEEGSLITGNKSSGVSIESGTFIMKSGAISGNNAYHPLGGGVTVLGGTFIMQGGLINSNTASGFVGGGGVVVSAGNFSMQGGTISGNASNSNGGGVFISNGKFSKTGGIINGNNASIRDRNTSSKGKGHAVYGSSSRWRNATAGPNDNTDGYGFWLND